MDPFTAEGNREGIQADKPVPPWEPPAGIQTGPSIPPWERPGCFRLDWGGLLALLAVGYVMLGTLAALLVVPAVVALPLCLTAFLMLMYRSVWR
jgi:hypothetical protein